MSTTLSPITSVNPATEEVLARFDPFTAEEVDAALGEAQDAFGAWRERSFADRAVPMRRLAALLRERADRYGRLITIEMGKPITEAKAE
ncbi:MAG TPA: aldehyde dehydrogenase family protein, partial [Candidatus Limnocylindria bacterium]|nr:aldehyde dehydrogenase family protein [Candidatus Limnocylindria bacterium]